MERRSDWMNAVAAATGADEVTPEGVLQRLWSGYGEIVRMRLSGAPMASVVVKQVRPPAEVAHPRGFGGGRSHARKLRSYQVEAAFYRRFAARCDEVCRVASAHGVEGDDGGWLFVLEDLDESGFARRRLDREGALADEDVAAAITWLARFHARFLGVEPEGLWPRGTYWHLATRQDEWEAMGDAALRSAAAAIDERLSAATPRTLVHGDAKLANFCFGEGRVAAVDFQYVGGGIGVQDLAYFLGSVFDERGLMAHAERWIDLYFEWLRADLAALGSSSGAMAPDEVEARWRAALPLAWADFERFLDGWAPNHWKRSGYAREQVRRALVELG